MADQAQQNLDNHTRWDPWFHFFAGPVIILNLIYALQHAIRHATILRNWWFVVVSAAALVGIFLVRIYALRVQDRVIRLEERLRLSNGLPQELRGRIGELEDGQLISLRFCSDDELPSLTKKALEEKLSRADIKKNIKSWRGDYSRV